ncbi:MAG: GNAT family N-acetyltransferase [Actinomycetia bacterium]|uniref:GNAT family N-acetyltransferase n=1 Tax=Streptomyces sp. NPDC020917 TaxID=3365102 RepID=UPI0027F82C72|nr:GNAT family N-acetyltransferase [Actinomycetes bacterium]MCL2732965.1 GNAT family N-acetyltransferase [Actinomycetes bacterium]
MIRGARIGLRARQESDLPVFHEEMYNDVLGFSRADGRPWRPASTPEDAGYKLVEPSDELAAFSVVELASGELAGMAVLWGIDLHHRSAHLGLGLRPSFRGRGLGSDVVRALCAYGFTVRGLRRLQLETLADNEAMLAAAERSGFRREGTLRRAGWVYGREVDEVILGLLHDEWEPQDVPPAADPA